MKPLLSKEQRTQKRLDAKVKGLIKRYPTFWPAVVVHHPESYRDMPADQFDWAIAQIQAERGR